MIFQTECDFAMKLHLYTNAMSRPLALDDAPVLSWKAENAPENYRQAAYQISVASSEEKLGCPDIYAGALVESDRSVEVKLPVALTASARYYWQVAVTDAQGQTTVSEPDWFETGLLTEKDWRAGWICAGNRYVTNWSMLMRREFSVRGRVKKAKAYISGLGVYVLHVNGRRVGDHVLDPAQTEFPQKVFYCAYDVTDMLQQGHNCLGVKLGDGWYHQSQLMEGYGIYGDPCLRLQLEIEYEGGTCQYVLSDNGFTCSLGPVTMNNLYVGETYDARLEQKGWDLPGFDDRTWYPAVPDTTPKGEMRAQLMPPIRVTREIKPVSMKEVVPGVFIFDMGLNMAGFARIHLTGTPGNEVTLRFSEALGPDGMLDVSTTGVFHIRGVQTQRYIFGETGEITWQPDFTYFGFRYIELTGAHCDVTEDVVTALKVHTDLAEKTRFECAMPLLNQMEQLLRNTFTSNIHGLPTDCPAREKCGWTGDANIISDTAMLMYDAIRFWDKYTEDIVTARKEHGYYPNVVPGKRGCLDTVPAWGTALINIPWYMYETYGAASMIEKYYDDMAAYTAHIEANTTNYLHNDHKYKLADWAAPYGYSSAEHFFQVSTAYYFRAVDVMSRCARLLGREEDAVRYADTAAHVKDAMNAAYYDYEQHTYGTQTLNSFCADIGMAPDGEEEAMAKWCCQDIAAHDYHITCGHIGIRYIFNFLTKHGCFETLEKLLATRTEPSFAHQIDSGATTLWEDAQSHTTGYSSLNHPFKGSYCVWLYEDVLGVKKNEPGYKTFTVKPETTSIIPWAKGSVDTVYGEIKVDYQLGDHFCVTVPANTTAHVFVPQTDGSYQEHHLGCGEYSL